VSFRAPATPQTYTLSLHDALPICALAYMGLKGGENIADIALDRVFIGSCTNGRIEDLRVVAKVVDGKTVNANVQAMIVPGSGLRSEEHTSELQSPCNLVCRLLLEK